MLDSFLKCLGSTSTKKTTLNWLVLLLFNFNIPLFLGYPRITALASEFQDSAFFSCEKATIQYFCAAIFPLIAVCLISWATFRPVWMAMVRRATPSRSGMVFLLVRSRFACSSLAFYLGHITAALLLAANLSSNSLGELVSLSLSSPSIESIPLFAILLTAAYYTWCSIVYCLVYSNMEQADKALDRAMQS